MPHKIATLLIYWVLLACMTYAQNIEDKYPAQISAFLNQCKKTNSPEYYQAACFLAENMQHYALGGKVISYDHQIDSLIACTDRLYYSLVKGSSGEAQEQEPLHGRIKRAISEAAGRVKHISFKEPHIEVEDIPDCKGIDTLFLRKHLDYAFLLRDNNPLVKQLSFENFCSYILPYRALSDYPLICCNEVLGSIFAKYLIPYNQHGPQELALGYNRTLWWLRKAQGEYPFDTMLGWPEVFFKGNHDCVDNANYATLILRACGIPAAVESNIAQRFSTSRHYMTAFIDKNGVWQKFDPEASGIVDKSAPAVRALNIYREHFEVLPSAPFALKQECEPLPEGLSAVGLEDVSELYMHTHKMILPLDTIPPHRNLVYLATFMPHSQGLLPVTWGRIVGDSAHFEHIVKDEVYYPVWIDDEEHYHLCAAPFLIEEDSLGVVQLLTFSDYIDAEQSENESESENISPITITRKYPQKPSFLKDAALTRGTYIIASDTASFTVADTIGIIDHIPDDRWENLPLTTERPYKYYRVQAPASDPHLHLGEIQFFSDQERILDEPLEKCQWKAEYDGKVNTAPDRWPSVTLSLSEPALVNRLRYIVKNSDNRVKPRHHYRLYELQEHGWHVVHDIISKNDTLEFTILKENHIYWLHDSSSHNNDELPFVIKNGGIFSPYESIIKKYNL